MLSQELATTSWYIDARLKAYYRFSTGALTTDSSGEGHTLTDIGDPVEVDGVFGKAADFDSNDAYSATDHADFKPTGSFTIGAWVKNNGLVSRQIFQSYSQASNVAGISIGTNSAGKATLTSGNNTGTTIHTNYENVIAATAVNDNNWHFVVGTWDENYLRIYTDGKLNAIPVAWTTAPAYADNNYVRVGRRNINTTGDRYWEGQLDEVFLINGLALSDSEIAAIYGATKSINSLAIAFVKSINGLPNANIKSFNNLT